MFGLADNLIKQFEQASLLRSHQLGVADDVDEEHISDLQLDLFLNLGHRLNRFYMFPVANPRLFFWRE